MELAKDWNKTQLYEDIVKNKQALNKVNLQRAEPTTSQKFTIENDNKADI